MSVPNNILVPVDFSDCSYAALVYAIDLAERLDADVDVLHVWQAPHVAVVEGQMPPLAVYAREQARESLEQLLASIDRRGVPVRGRLATGDPVETIIHLAAAFDLVVMGRHGRGRLAHLFLGSVTEKVMRRSPCPVVGIHAPLEVVQQSHSDALEGANP